MTTPKQIRIISGNDAERQEMIELLLAQGTIKALNHELRPDSYLALTDPRDVARVESRTFVCSEHQDDAGPTKTLQEIHNS